MRPSIPLLTWFLASGLVAACATVPEPVPWTTVQPTRESLFERFDSREPSPAGCDWDSLFAAGVPGPFDGALRALLEARPDRFLAPDCRALEAACAFAQVPEEHGLDGAEWARFCPEVDGCRAEEAELAELEAALEAFEPPLLYAPVDDVEGTVVRYADHLAEHAPAVAAGLRKRRALREASLARACSFSVAYGRLAGQTAAALLGGRRGADGYIVGELARLDAVPGDFFGRMLPAGETYGHLVEGYRRYRELAESGEAGADGGKRDALRVALAAYRRSVPPWESTFMVVQMPQAFLELYVDGIFLRRFRTVIGSARTEKEEGSGERLMPNATPVLDSAITAIIFHPEWNVPGTIAREEIEPRLEKDPGMLHRKGMRREVYADGSVRYVQDPGPLNALGKVKFHFDNSHDVYLHDTPEKSFFRKPRRLFSHGCVRVQRAVKLALLLLARDQGFTWDRLKTVLKEGKTTEYKLVTPIPVHLLYSTAAADSDGNLYFFPDLYGRE